MTNEERELLMMIGSTLADMRLKLGGPNSTHFADKLKKAVEAVDVPVKIHAGKKMTNLHSEETGEYAWDNLQIDFVYLAEDERYLVTVHNADGLVITRKLRLHEWSGEFNGLLNKEDGPSLVAWLKNHQKLYEDTGDDSGTVERQE